MSNNDQDENFDSAFEQPVGTNSTLTGTFTDDKPVSTGEPADDTPPVEVDDGPLVLTKLEIQAVKRIRIARFRPGNKPLFKIGGKNGQGKSSILDSFEMLLGGKRSVPAEPIHRGKRRGEIVGTLGTPVLGDRYVLTRSFSSSGGTSIEVKRADGGKIKGGPQEFIDDLLGDNKTLKALAFDPYAFATMKVEDQDKLCKLACGLDFTAIDEKRDKIEEERKGKAQTVKQLEGQLAGMKEHDGVGSTEESVADLTAQLEQCNATLTQQQALDRAVEAAERESERCRQDYMTKAQTVVRLKAEMAEAERQAEALKEHANTAAADVIVRERVRDEHTVSDPAPIRAKLATVQETNAKVRDNAARADVQKRLDTARDELEDVKGRRENVDVERKEMLDNATYPIESMGFDELGPTLSGFPLDQASQSQKIRLGVAIGCVLNPGIGVFLIRQGSLLDEDSELALEDELRKRKCQALVEVVSSDGDGCSLFIEDGEIKAAPAPAEPQALRPSGPVLPPGEDQRQQKEHHRE